MIYANFTCVSILHGMNQAITVMVAVSYGHQDWRNCETILQRGRLINIFANIPMAIIIYYNQQVLEYFNVNPKVIENAGEFIIIYFIGRLVNSQFDCYRQYLNSTNQSHVIKYTSFISLVFHVLWLYLFCKFYEFGAVGVAIATLLTSIVNFLVVMIYCWKFSPKNLVVRPFYFKLSLLLKKEYVKTYLALAFPSIIMVCVQMYAYEILLLMASGISVVCFGSMIISTSYLGLCMILP